MKKLYLLLPFWLFVNSCSHSTPEDSDVKNIARMHIIHNMKDPTSLEFFHNEIFSKQGDSIFMYNESLKALNGFGFKIPQNCFVKLKWIGGDPSEPQNWRLIDLQLENR